MTAAITTVSSSTPPTVLAATMMMNLACLFDVSVNNYYNRMFHYHMMIANTIDRYEPVHC